MKHIITLVLFALCLEAMGHNVMRTRNISAIGDGAQEIIPPLAGQTIVNDTLIYNVESSGILSVYTPSIVTKNTDPTPVAGSSVTFEVDFGADGQNPQRYVGVEQGKLINIGDHILVQTTNGWHFGAIQSEDGGSTFVDKEITVTISPASTDDYVTNGKVYFVDGDDDTTKIPLTTGQAGIQLKHLFSGNLNMPVIMEVDAGTGATTTFSGIYHSER